MITDAEYVLHGALGYASIHDYADARHDWTVEQVASSLVATLSEADIRLFAEAYVRDQVDGWRRYKARQVEEASERQVSPFVVSIGAAQPVEAQFAKYRDDPVNQFIGNAKQRRQFRKWMGDEFESWLYSSQQQIQSVGDEDALDSFRADWHEDGPREYYRMKMVIRLSVAADKIIAAESKRIRLEVTRELLQTAFALGDGTRVTWGTATIDQHEQRIQLLTGNIVGNMETAARHKAAIAMLQDHGAARLEELAMQVAA